MHSPDVGKARAESLVDTSMPEGWTIRQGLRHQGLDRFHTGFVALGWGRARRELVDELIAENRGQRALHDRATAAHVAARGAALDGLGRAGRTLSTAAGRLTDDYYRPGAPPR